MGFTTFLVDDDPGVLKALSRIVRTAGYDSVCYSSPQDFLREYDPSTPGCVVLDLTMPELDGLELQQHLARAGDKLPIIFLSGQADIPASVRAMKAGAIDFLVKPVNRETLLSAIEQARERDGKARQARCEWQSIEGETGQADPARTGGSRSRRQGTVEQADCGPAGHGREDDQSASRAHDGQAGGSKRRRSRAPCRADQRRIKSLRREP